MAVGKGRDDEKETGSSWRGNVLDREQRPLCDAQITHVTPNILEILQLPVSGTSPWGGFPPGASVCNCCCRSLRADKASTVNIRSSHEPHMADGKTSYALSCRRHTANSAQHSLTSEWRFFPNVVARTGTPRACRHRSAAGYDVRLLKARGCMFTRVGSCEVPALFSEHSSWPECFRHKAVAGS